MLIIKKTVCVLRVPGIWKLLVLSAQFFDKSHAALTKSIN